MSLFNIFLKYHVRQKQFSFFNNAETRIKTLFLIITRDKKMCQFQSK